MEETKKFCSKALLEELPFDVSSILNKLVGKSIYDDAIDVVEGLNSYSYKKPMEFWLRSTSQNIMDPFVSSETLPVFESENHWLYSAWKHFTAFARNAAIVNVSNAGYASVINDANKKRSISIVEDSKPLLLVLWQMIVINILAMKLDV